MALALALAPGRIAMVNSSSVFAPHPLMPPASARLPTAMHRVAANRRLASAIAGVAGSRGSAPPAAELGPILAGSRFTAGTDIVRRGHGAHVDFTVRALEGTGGSSGDGCAHDEARMNASKVLELVKFHARLRVMVDLVSLQAPAGREIRSEMNKMAAIDPAAPAYHWTILRFKARVRSILGDDVYNGLMDRVVKLDKLDDEHRCLITNGGYVVDMLEALMAETKYSIMHPYPGKAALPFDHAVYDISTAFLKTLCGIAAELYFNIDLLSFKRNPLVPLHHMAANHACALLHAHDAITDFYEVLHPSVDVGDDPDTVKRELKMHYNILRSDEEPAQVNVYLGNLCEKHSATVGMSLKKLAEDMRALRA